MYALSDYDYHLPPECIAHKPAAQRDRSRLLCLDRARGHVRHSIFNQLEKSLNSGDILVVNNTEVIPGRLYGHKSTGGKVEVLILDYTAGQGAGQHIHECLIRASKSPKPGTRIIFNAQLSATVLAVKGQIQQVEFHPDGDFQEMLYRLGSIPLPPYIQRDPSSNEDEDRRAYQTVYASQKGAIAAPTAGLHFTPELMTRLTDKGVKIVQITLHVGYGTFVPVRVDDIRRHRMHSERFTLTPLTADIINKGKKAGARIVAVGTTCVRTLEYATDEHGAVASGSGLCDLFIYPGYRFRTVDAMITNFHLPKSTLLMLVSAFAGREAVLAAYGEAMEKGYRFYSYGDAMLIV
jgi:S-adenosylmethionine:tRNA ribosyltransferase-isomerase